MIIVMGLVLFSAWFLLKPERTEPERIQRTFQNGKEIDIEVDETITRNNWDCTDDCSGHEAGYEWAENKGITDPSDCGGNSESFIEGCEAYVNE
ncbi:MAG: hypothetical protein COU69_00450 [Candidatus Pacebacteria bacterium CG10_big_fil_rev_8_21_14_0_10_56_10]|nr:MAG: hypothetical protein COU69_00450 [Candidatus Pacebacteria bacterium CG10_big_fil_rev_8_21_14_0_10_56_10]